MTERIWGVIGTEYVFEQARDVDQARNWAQYEGTDQMPIKGRPAFKEAGVLYWPDGSPVDFVEGSDTAS